MLNETGFKTPLLLNYTQWEDGQTGGVGMFSANGAANENYRVMADDPWGKRTVVWEARTDSASDADGGWDSSYIPIDPGFTYRLSTWVRRPVTGNGSFYFGCRASPTVLQRYLGGADGNPYFWAGTPSADWELVVGHIHPANSGTGPVHPDSGRYTVNGKFAGIGSDFTFASGTTALAHRTYLFYSTDTSTKQQWAYPRIDKCDGTEPSIADLLAGHDSRSFEHVKRLGGTQKQHVHLSNAMNVDNISEVGVTEGLVAYYPLNKDARDYSGNSSHGTVFGAALVGGGFDGRGAYRFDGVDDYIRMTTAPMNPTSHTISGWFLKRSHTSNSYPIFLSYSLPYIACDGASSPFRVSYSGPSQVNAAGGIIPALNTWYHVCAVFDTNGVSLYVNGTLQNRNPALCTNTGATFDIGRHINSNTYAVNGDICNIKIFNRALSPEEVAVEYKRTGPTKMSQYNGTVYIQGQIKETI